MIGTSRITSKGQVTIPQHLRHMLNISTGDQIVFDIDHSDQSVKLKKAGHQSLVEQLSGSLPTNKPYEDITIVREKAGKIYGKKYDIS